MKKSRIHRSLALIYVLLMSACLMVTWLANRAVTVWSNNQPLPAGRCVVIDAGHGGVDGGTTSCTGILESQYNLEIALRLNDLMHLLGVNTVMIRTEDISIYTSGTSIAQKKISDLKERVRITNETEDGILLSLHQNYFSDGRYSGPQVFYAPTHGSLELAKQLQNELNSSLSPKSNRQVKKASGIYLMQHIHTTGVLVECGFLSNIQEEALLREPDYQKRLCAVLSTTINTYLYKKNSVA